MSHMPEGGEP